MSQSIPETVGKYQVIREIARSNDIVYEAYDPVMNRRVALKELAVPSASTAQQREDRIKRFMREAKAAGSLAHPHIVTIYEVDEDAGRHFIAMEYLDGQNLRNVLDTKGFVEPVRAAEIATCVLDALEFAHAHGVIHRDVKPDNVQILADGAIKLTDFGIARLTFEPNITIDGQVFGTPSYMSPEQINGREIDARSDVFSVGVILYEMVAGQKPFQGDNVVAITYSIMNSHPVQPSQCNHGLWQIIMSALEKSPQLRFGSAKDMAAALRQWSDASKAGVVVLDPVPAPPLPTLGYSTGPPPVIVPAQSQNPYFGPYQPYGQTGQQLPQVPIYYPPPPRPPLVTPETRRTLGKLVLVGLLVGALVGLVFLTVNGIAGAVKPKGAPVSAPAMGPQSTVPVPAPSSPESAEILVRQAESEPDVDRRIQQFSEAARAWAEVVAQDHTYQGDAVGSFLGSASRLRDRGDVIGARQAFYQASGFASGNDELTAAVEAWAVN